MKSIEELPAWFEQLNQQAQSALAAASSSQGLEAARVKYLGAKSEALQVMKGIGSYPPEQRGLVGKLVNDFKKSCEAQLSRRRLALESQPSHGGLDVTLPGRAVSRGRLHPITQMTQHILAQFVPMGFEVLEGPEMEFEYYNFDALNIPQDHPSRESFDTFFVDLASPQPGKGKLVLRSHTSPVQVRAMEKQRPPLRIVVPGRVFRPDPLDPSHSFMFHQIEGLMVDNKTSFADLKGVVEQVLKALFGPSTKTRFRPHFFPFTEPSAEVDIACTVCGGQGCTTCARKGWIEIMGCGMVHPNVFKAVGYDSQRVQGFAFGMGVERMTMLKYGVKDIRLFFENDARFLEQF